MYSFRNKLYIKKYNYNLYKCLRKLERNGILAPPDKPDVVFAILSPAPNHLFSYPVKILKIY